MNSVHVVLSSLRMRLFICVHAYMSYGMIQYFGEVVVTVC